MPGELAAALVHTGRGGGNFKRGKCMETHKAANALPLMDESRFASLCESIRSEGLLQDITLCDGKIVDGRNRYNACLAVGVEPRFQHFAGDPWAYVDGIHKERDLGLDQRFLYWHFLVQRSGQLQRTLAAIEDEANRKRSEAARERQRSEAGTFEASDGPVWPTTGEHVSRQAMALASGTNESSVKRMWTLVSRRPDLADLVRMAEMKPTAALRLMRKAEVAVKVRALPAGQYRVIYADPPWQYNDQRAGGGEGYTGATDHYPTMSMADLQALDVRLLAAPDAVLFCWATFPLLPDQIEVLEAWGFQYKTAFVWSKQRSAFGNYHKADAELLLVGTRGSCTPDADIRESQVQTFPRGEHSAKPEEWRALIDRLYPHGPRIELFRRGAAPDGWVVWGAEAESEAA